VLRLVFDLVTLLVFGVAAAATFFVAYHGHEATRQLVMAGLAGVMLVRLVAVAARFLLAPRDPGARLLSFDDAAARRLHGAVVALAGIYAVADIGLGLLVHWGLAEDVYLLLHLTLVLLFVGLFLYACWRSRADIAVLIRGGEGTGPLRRLLAELWPVLMTLYVAIIVLAGVIERLSGMRFAGYAGIWSLLIVIVLPLVDLAGSRLLAAEMGARGDGSGASAYEPVLRQGIHIVLTVAGLLLIARLWGLDLFALSTRSVGDRLTQALFSIAVTLLVAYLAWRLLRTAIDRRLEREAGPRAGREPGEEGGGQGASRLRTLLPMVRAFVFVSLCVMATMISLASLGLNIGPLLAGAGVVGIALGFGAQTLVRDIVSGMFFLIDDAFRLGEYIDVGPVKGTVEKISLRSMQIRHHRGALHTVPYGQITRLTNESRDWVIVKLEFRLTYDADLVQVKRILKRIGEELQQDPELGPSILQPLKSQGIMGTDDSALVVRAKFMAKPDDRQYVVRREAYNRIVKAFAESGIRFAHRQVTVFAPPGAGAGAAGAASAALADGKTDGTAGI
jgi:small-conductance mechanosensitive channel